MPTMFFGTITTVAGTGEAGYAGDGGPAPRARLRQPFGCDFDRAGNLTIAEAENHVIRRVDKDTGRISTVAGSGRKGYDGDGGPATEAALNEPYAVSVDDAGDLFLVDRLNACIRRVNRHAGIITTVARAPLREPNDCALDGRGGLLIADVGDSRIYRLDLETNVLSVWGGTGRRARAGDGGPVAAASFFGARAVAVDRRDGMVYVCEREGNVVRRIDAKTGIVTTFAGTGAKGATGDGGPAVRATFNGPKGVRCDRQGNVFVVDTENHAVRRIDARTGIITTVAGGRRGGMGDGGPATEAGLARPHGVAIAPDGALLIADSGNHRVRRAPMIGKIGERYNENRVH